MVGRMMDFEYFLKLKPLARYAVYDRPFDLAAFFNSLTYLTPECRNPDCISVELRRGLTDARALMETLRERYPEAQLVLEIFPRDISVADAVSLPVNTLIWVVEPSDEFALDGVPETIRDVGAGMKVTDKEVILLIRGAGYFASVGDPYPIPPDRTSRLIEAGNRVDGIIFQPLNSRAVADSITFYINDPQGV